MTTVVVAVTLAVTAAAALAGGSTPHKNFSAFISAPPSAAATTTQATTSVGSTASVGISLRNDTKSQRLGSANITVPAGVTVQPGSVVLVAPPGGSATLYGNLIKLRDLYLQPGQSAFVTFAAVVPCTAGAASYQFGIAAKESNQFNGSGNDLKLVTPLPLLSGIGSCVPCPGGQCTASTSSTRSAASVSGLAAAGDRLRVSLGAPDAPAVDCSGYAESTETVAFDLTNSAGGSAGGLKTVKLQIKNPTKAANLYKICFQAGDATPPVILPACKCGKGGTPINVPCAQPVEYKKGVVTLTAITPAGDPWIKG